MLKTVLFYGLALAAGAVALQWLEYQIWARAHAGTIYVALIAAAFMGLGIWVGARLFRKESRGSEFTPNERAQSSLGITEREREVLQLLADGRSNKEIARAARVVSQHGEDPRCAPVREAAGCKADRGHFACPRARPRSIVRQAAGISGDAA